jgi:hypothetical protein
MGPRVSVSHIKLVATPKAGRSLKLTTHLHPVPRLRMNDTTSVLLLLVFMAVTAMSYVLNLTKGIISEVA